MKIPTWLREDSAESVDFGGLKCITYFGGICLLINNAVGPGLVFLPVLFQKIGIWLCILIIIVLSYISYILSMAMVECIQKIPDNDDFSLRIEYLDLIKYYCEPIEAVTIPETEPNSIKTRCYHSRTFSIFCQCAFGLFLVTMMVTNIIQCSQSVDMLLADLFGAS